MDQPNITIGENSIQLDEGISIAPQATSPEESLDHDALRREHDPNLTASAVQYLRTDELEPHKSNAAFSDGAVTVDIEEIALSIKSMGFLEPITLLPGTKIILDGYHRCRAAENNKREYVPVVYAAREMTEPEILLYFYESATKRKHMSLDQKVQCWKEAFGGEQKFIEKYKRSFGKLKAGDDYITNSQIAKLFNEKPDTVRKCLNRYEVKRGQPDSTKIPENSDKKISVNATDNSGKGQVSPQGTEITGKNSAPDGQGTEGKGESPKQSLAHQKKMIKTHFDRIEELLLEGSAEVRSLISTRCSSLAEKIGTQNAK